MFCVFCRSLRTSSLPAAAERRLVDGPSASGGGASPAAVSGSCCATSFIKEGANLWRKGHWLNVVHHFFCCPKYNSNSKSTNLDLEADLEVCSHENHLAVATCCPMPRLANSSFTQASVECMCAVQPMSPNELRWSLSLTMSSYMTSKSGLSISIVCASSAAADLSKEWWACFSKGPRLIFATTLYCNLISMRPLDVNPSCKSLCNLWKRSWVNDIRSRRESSNHKQAGKPIAPWSAAKWSAGATNRPSTTHLGTSKHLDPSSLTITLVRSGSPVIEFGCMTKVRDDPGASGSTWHLGEKTVMPNPRPLRIMLSSFWSQSLLVRRWRCRPPKESKHCRRSASSCAVSSSVKSNFKLSTSDLL